MIVPPFGYPFELEESWPPQRCTSGQCTSVQRIAQEQLRIAGAYKYASSKSARGGGPRRLTTGGLPAASNLLRTQ